MDQTAYVLRKSDVRIIGYIVARDDRSGGQRAGQDEGALPPNGQAEQWLGTSRGNKKRPA